MLSSLRQLYEKRESECICSCIIGTIVRDPSKSILPRARCGVYIVSHIVSGEIEARTRGV